jgi:hypothetical protein
MGCHVMTRVAGTAIAVSWRARSLRVGMAALTDRWAWPGRR